MRKVEIRNLIWLLPSFLVVVLDQLSKIYIERNLDFGQKIKVIDNFLYITYAKNTGAAWGMFSEHTIYLALFSIISTLALVFVLLMLKRGFAAFSVCLVIGGAVGNAIDRIRLGYVVDFIDTYIFKYDFPVFNVADSAITVGVIFLFIYILFIHREIQT